MINEEPGFSREGTAMAKMKKSSVIAAIFLKRRSAGAALCWWNRPRQSANRRSNKLGSTDRRQTNRGSAGHAGGWRAAAHVTPTHDARARIARCPLARRIGINPRRIGFHGDLIKSSALNMFAANPGSSFRPYKNRCSNTAGTKRRNHHVAARGIFRAMAHGISKIGRQAAS